MAENLTTPAAPADHETITKDDAAWILSNSFLILTMQTGFGMLEAGCVSPKNVANIMIKNVIDVTVGGITYWSVGYGLSFGRPSNLFCGFGNFFLTADNQPAMGTMYTHYVFHFSFATAATTIVSGAVAERMKLTSYIIFSAVNTFIYCLPASWVWNDTGFLKKLHFFDFAGASVVHLSGGTSALVAAKMLGPRLGRFSDSNDSSNTAMSSPVTALTGTFMLWWAWLSFNCGSSFGISRNLWKTAAKVGVTTLNGSVGGSLAGIILSVAVNWKQRYFDITYIITSVLGGLIGVTCGCAVISPAESLLIGSIGGIVAIGFLPLLEKLKIDDPVGAVPVHFAAAIWSTVSVGLFGQNEFNQLHGENGLLHGGGFRLLGIQVFGAVVIASWSMVTTFLTFSLMKLTIGIRMSPQEELLGADWVEHRVRSENFAAKLEKALKELHIDRDDEDEVARKVLKEITEAKADRRHTLKNVDYYIRNVAGPATPGPERLASSVPRERAKIQFKKNERNIKTTNTSDPSLTPINETENISMYKAFKRSKLLKENTNEPLQMDVEKLA